MPAVNSTTAERWIGKRFGRVVILEMRPYPLVYARCDCGIEREFNREPLKSGASKSCGCWRAEKPTTHGSCIGHKVTTEYRVWSGIIQRCLNPKNKAYKNYGGRGILVCDDWLKFENFLADMGKKPSPNHSIDRINNDGNYEPSNCRWATWKEQAANHRPRSDSVMITYDGKTMNCTDWAKSIGIKPGTLSKRIRSGWPIDLAITKPVISSYG